VAAARFSRPGNLLLRTKTARMGVAAVRLKVAKMKARNDGAGSRRSGNVCPYPSRLESNFLDLSQL